MIEGYSEEEFGIEIHKHVRPSKPIDTIELLKGRQTELDEIRRALFADGRHIFIYGDRGIGKSSLAQTAAFQYQTSDASIIQIGCTKTSTFLEVMESIARRLIDSLDVTEIQAKSSINLKIIKLELSYKTIKKPETPKI